MSATADLATLFGTPAAANSHVGASVPAPPNPATARHWTRAYDQWLSELPSEATRNTYQRAWRDLLDFTGKAPSAIRSADVRDWVLDLGERPLDPAAVKRLKRKGRRRSRFGYSPATINVYLVAISSF